MSSILRRVSVLAVLVVVAVSVGAAIRHARDDRGRNYLGADSWPVHGQAAYVIGTSAVRASADQHQVPIASLAKVMTAYLVLRQADRDFVMTVTTQDAVDTARRGQNGESTVAVRAGEVLTERQALIALLLPSANNVAIMLARRVSGSVGAFVDEMNRTARLFGMRHTVYTDPSGLDAGTMSTAADQLVLARIAMRNRAFGAVVRMKQATIPVAGTVRSTDQLLGIDGFVGIKTGSDDAAGGCFMFRAVRDTRTVTGVVLGQPGHDLVVTAQYAAKQLVDQVAPVG